MAYGASEVQEAHACEVLAFNVRDVTTSLSPCPAKFQAKVAYWKDALAHDVRTRQLSLEDILKKQERAQQQREEVFQGLTARISKKRISADERPQKAKKPKQDAAQLAERLESAENARHSRLKHVSRSSGERVARAKAVAASGREAAAALADTRLRLSQARLAAAAARRASALRNISAAHAHRAPDAFLRSNAARIESLRHSGSLRRIQGSWRHFAAAKGTTSARVKAFVNTSVPGTFQPALKVPRNAEDQETPTTSEAHLSSSPHSPSIGMFGSGSGMQWQRDFDDLSATMQSPKTLRAAKELLHRLEQLARVLHHNSNPDCSMLLRRLYPKAAQSGKRIERYPARIFLCAYMLMWQPDMLLTGTSEWDERLKSTAEALVSAFETLIVKYVPKTEDSGTAAEPVPGSSGRTMRNALKMFDEAWVDFLEIFVTWKGEDAASIERDLIAVAVDMQASMLAAVGADDAGQATEAADLNVQTAAIVAQVEHDQALLRSRVERLSGPEAVARFDEAVAAATPSTRPRSIPRSPSSSRSPTSARSASTASLQNRRLSGSPAPFPDPANRRVSTSALSPSRAPPQQPVEEAPAVPFPDQNEVILHKLLINPSFRLPLESVSRRWEAVMDATGDRVPMDSLDMSRADPAALRAHITATAQDALADAALQQLSSVPADATAASLATARAASFSQMSGIISELAAEAFASLPENHPALAQQQEFSQETLAATFSTAASLQACVAAVAGLLDRTVQLILQIGAPGREAKAKEAVTRVTGLLHSALASAPQDSPEQHTAVASILARALRLLMAQMRVLNSDGANGRLALLSAMLTPADTIRLVRSKLAVRAGITPTSAGASEISTATPESDASAQEQPAGQQEGVVSVSSVATKLPISARFAASSPSADHVDDKVAALQTAYGDNPTATLPATIQAGQRTSAGTAAPPPPGSLLASPVLLAGTATDTWRARFRAAVVALLGTPADFAGNPQGPEVLHAYGDMLDQSKGLFQKAVVIGVCMHVATESISAKGQAPLSQDESSDLLHRLHNIEAAGSDGLLAATATVISDAVASRSTASQPQEPASLENDVRARLETALSAGGPALQSTAAELIHIIQALLVFGRCEGFECLPEAYVAKDAPPKWANALLVRSSAPNALHKMLGEVAHGLGRICSVAEAAYGDLLETLFAAVEQ